MQVVAGTLYVVGTPLGNLSDLSPRAREVLAGVDAVLAEDTRRTRALLTHLNLHKPLRSLHAHNEQAATGQVLAQLAAGSALALVSDAGTPAVSDPGALLLEAVHAAGAQVGCVPGPSALSAAMSVAGFAHERGDALFVGFLPRTGSARRRARERLQNFAGVAVLFESPARLATTLRELAEAQPQRAACVCRELTKLHEEVRRAPLAELADWAGAKNVRGECTLVLGPLSVAEADAAQPTQAGALDPATAVRRCLDAGLRVRDAASAVCALLGVPRRQAYTLALAAAAGEGGHPDGQGDAGAYDVQDGKQDQAAGQRDAAAAPDAGPHGDADG